MSHLPTVRRVVSGLLLLFMATPALAQSTPADDPPETPRYRRTSYRHASITLENPRMRVTVFKRLGGWGWGEIYTAEGKCMAILDHLGEIMLRDQDIPMRLEAGEVHRRVDEQGDSLVFPVKSTVVREKLRGTSFENWMSYPLEHPCLEGEVTLTLHADQPLLFLRYRLTATGNFYARYIRGPWLRVGEAEFGTAKDDAIFPGIEWAIDDEWSSGSDWFKYPWSERFVPHPYKVTSPVMALSHEGTGIGLAWNPHQTVTRWFNYRGHRPQPVFAVPNFIDRMNHSLMGLMVPDASNEGAENQVYAELPLELRIDQAIQFDAEIWLSRGNSLEVLVDWVKRHGLPEPPPPRWPLPEALERIAAAYNTHFWHDNEGFGIRQVPGQVSPHVPVFLDRFVKENAGTPLAEQLRTKIAWCRSRQASGSSAPDDREQALARGHALLALQQPDGSFPFDPDGRHYMKDDFVVARSFIEPMGLGGDTALDLCVTPVLELLQLADVTGEDAFREGAKKALEYCMPMTRPEGGDFWETPLHAPNLLAAGHAALAYYAGYQALGDERYKRKAIYWIRSILPFTHLWHPADVPMLYNTKPCLCSSDWYFANWVRDHVQWEVLQVFAASTARGVRWDRIDPEIDWRRFHEGITVAALRWMIDHADDTWRPHNLPSTYELYQQGQFDYCYADTHNSTTGNYGGMFIMPDPIALNIYGVLDSRDD